MRLGAGSFDDTFSRQRTRNYDIESDNREDSRCEVILCHKLGTVEMNFWMMANRTGDGTMEGPTRFLELQKCIRKSL